MEEYALGRAGISSPLSLRAGTGPDEPVCQWGAGSGGSFQPRASVSSNLGGGLGTEVDGNFGTMAKV